MKYKLLFITGRKKGFKDERCIIVYTPDKVEINELVGMFDNVLRKDPLLPLHDLLDKVIPHEQGWGWKHLDFDASIRVSA